MENASESALPSSTAAPPALPGSKTVLTDVASMNTLESTPIYVRGFLAQLRVLLTSYFDLSDFLKGDGPLKLSAQDGKNSARAETRIGTKDGKLIIMIQLHGWELHLDENETLMVGEIKE